MTERSDVPKLAAAGEQLVERVLTLGVDGVGPWHSAEVVAKQARAITDDPEIAIQQLLSSHRRLVGATGFITGVGGAMALVVGLPADVTSFYAAAARLSAATAALRGYDVGSSQVRSLVLLTLLGADGAALLRDIGLDPRSRSLVTDMDRLPAAQLTELNHTVGYRLVAKFGRKSAGNLVKLVPFVGGGVGAGVNVVGINAVGRYAKLTFPPNRFGPYNSPGVTIIEH